MLLLLLPVLEVLCVLPVVLFVSSLEGEEVLGVCFSLARSSALRLSFSRRRSSFAWIDSLSLRLVVVVVGDVPDPMV